MFRRLLPYILIAAVFLLDTAVLPALTGFWAIPVFSLILAHCLGLELGRSRGLLYGLIAGLLVDITVSTPFGLMTVIFALMGYAGGWFGYLLWRNRLASVISASVCFTLYELIMDLYVIFSAMRYSGALFYRSAIRIVIYVALVFLLRFPLDAILKPDKSRFARR